MDSVLKVRRRLKEEDKPKAKPVKTVKFKEDQNLANEEKKDDHDLIKNQTTVRTILKKRRRKSYLCQKK